MSRYSRSICIILFQSLFMLLQAQPNRYGVPIISNYEHYVTGGSEQNWCITQDFRGIMYIGNNDKGVLEYDGVEWRTIPLPNNPYVRSLVTGDDGIVYVGADGEFGYLAPDGRGDLQYRTLSDTIRNEEPGFRIGEIWKTYYVKDRVYFCSPPMIYVYEPDERELKMIETPDHAFLSYFIDNELYVGDYSSGLMRLEADSFVVVTGGDNFSEMNISGLVRFDTGRLLVATYYQGIFLLDLVTGEVNRSFVDPDLNEYLKNGVITYLHPLDRDFAVATYYSG
ncbi:MAG TPA: hypothetical protein ENO20_05320, partial [Bacteroides sp.]|nr:hypothetical protein [Bacteroides sp.]